jgi:hypothetical protein
MFVHCFRLRGHHAVTNEIASPLCKYSWRVRTRGSTIRRCSKGSRQDSPRGLHGLLNILRIGTMGRSHERHELAPVYEFVKLFWIRLLWMTSDIYVDFLLYV